MDEGNKKNTKIDWLKKNFFNIIFALIFGIGGYLLWNNTKPQEPKSIQELINTIKDNAKTVIEDSTNVIPPKIDDFLKDYTVIKKDKIENILKAVALVSRQEAAEDYHKSFSIFVAMLALFGIGFPAFVAFLQHIFNEKELNKIEKTSEDAAKATDEANAAVSKADAAIENIEEVNFDMHNEMIVIYNGLGLLFNFQSQKQSQSHLQSDISLETFDCYYHYFIGQCIFHTLKLCINFDNFFNSAKDNFTFLNENSDVLKLFCKKLTFYTKNDISKIADQALIINLRNLCGKIEEFLNNIDINLKNIDIQQEQEQKTLNLLKTLISQKEIIENIYNELEKQLSQKNNK